MPLFPVASSSQSRLYTFMTAFLSLKNNYYARRLAPFLIVYLIYELVEVAILAFLQQTGTDWSAAALLRLLGNLLVETCSSFLYLIIPYLLYLAALQDIPWQQDGSCGHHSSLCALLPAELL